MDKENLELAAEHINLAEDLIKKEGFDAEGEKAELMKKAAFDLEKAGAELAEGSD
jgi:hypothetical protein